VSVYVYVPVCALTADLIVDSTGGKECERTLSCLVHETLDVPKTFTTTENCQLLWN